MNKTSAQQTNIHALWAARESPISLSDRAKGAASAGASSATCAAVSGFAWSSCDQALFGAMAIKDSKSATTHRWFSRLTTYSGVLWAMRIEQHTRSLHEKIRPPGVCLAALDPESDGAPYKHSIVCRNCQTTWAQPGFQVTDNKFSQGALKAPNTNARQNHSYS